MAIEARYSNWQWQPPEVINPDQQRTRAINSSLSANHWALQCWQSMGNES